MAINDDLIRNEYFMDSMTHLVRERIPERLVHAKGAGAFGYFEVTHDISHICKAKFLSAVGKRTPVVTRFSPVVADRGGSDTDRDARGFAIKFYTEDGNFDIVGFNFPMFIIKDPDFFPTFVHTQKRNPQTNLHDKNMYWDFLTQRPEALHMFLLVLSGRGIPDGYRHMPGYGIHTYEVVNDQGDHYYVRFHFVPDAGIRNLTSTEGIRLSGREPDYATRDLYNAIENGRFPSWSAAVQILTLDDVENAPFDVFDTSRTIPLDEYPLQFFGRFVLNKNPSNYFADMEQLAFSPANLVPGILGGVDRLFEARMLAYRDAQYYRLGSNFNKINVNCPLLTKALTNLRDGKAPVKDNESGHPNYYPNSFHGPKPYVEKKKSVLLKIIQDESKNFDQARTLYEVELTSYDRSTLAQNIVESLLQAAPFLRERAVKLYTVIHPDLGRRVAEGLRVNGSEYYWEGF